MEAARRLTKPGPDDANTIWGAGDQGGRNVGWVNALLHAFGGGVFSPDYKSVRLGARESLEGIEFRASWGGVPEAPPGGRQALARRRCRAGHFPRLELRLARRHGQPRAEYDGLAGVQEEAGMVHFDTEHTLHLVQVQMTDDAAHCHRGRGAVERGRGLRRPTGDALERPW